MLFKYAWKGFFRRRTRSLLAVLGIALSVALLVAIISISSAVERAVSDSLGAAGADMIIQRRVKPCPFAPVKIPKDLGPIPADVVDKIAAIDRVEAASGVLVLWAFYGSLYESHPTVVAGIDPTKKTIGPVRIAEKKTDGKGKEEKGCCAVTKGRYLVRYDDYQVMLTEQYAKAIGADVGQKIHLGPKDLFQVVGLVDLSGSARIAEAEAFIPIKTAQKMYAEYGGNAESGIGNRGQAAGPARERGALTPGPSPSGRGEKEAGRMGAPPAFAKASAGTPYGPSNPGKPEPVVDTIFVALKSARAIPLVSAVVQQWIGSETSITTSQNVDAATSAVATVARKSMLGVSGLVLFFALLLIVRNAVSSVVERLAEVGLMRALGWRHSEVSRLFVIEEMIGGVIGGLLGCGVGWLLAFGYSQVADLKLPSALSSFPQCAVTPPPLALPLSTNPSLLVFAVGLVAALLIGSVAGLAASRRAARLDPAEALRRL